MPFFIHIFHEDRGLKAVVPVRSFFIILLNLKYYTLADLLAASYRHIKLKTQDVCIIVFLLVMCLLAICRIFCNAGRCRKPALVHNRPLGIRTKPFHLE